MIVTRSDLGDMLVNSRIHGDSLHARLTRTIAVIVRRAKGRTEEWLWAGQICGNDADAAFNTGGLNS
jgi:hypothetical protein